MSNNLAVMQKDITDQVSGKLVDLEKTGLNFPANYNPQNALKSAFFKLQEVKDSSKRPALEVCSKESIANTLLDMVVQGLSPAKNQCYFIVYGQSLQLSRSYFGTQAVLKRLNGVKDIWSNVIYEEDEFVMAVDKGREVLVEHKTKFENRDGAIKGVYCIIEKEDGIQELTVMTRKEVEQSWSQAKTKNVHNKFPQEMAKRTVINRAAKNIINTSDDSDLLIEAINQSTENEYDNERKEVSPIEDVQNEIDDNANQTIIDFEDEPKEQKKVMKQADTVPENEEAQQENLFDVRQPPIDQVKPGF